MTSLNKQLLVFTAPSGAGKTTIVKYLLDRYSEFAFSVSATTRPRRVSEVEGQDYYFIDTQEFILKADQGDFAEWEEVYAGQYYGTLKSEVKRLTNLGKCVLFDIDVKGALKLKSLYGDKCHTVFVKPPSIEILILRLKNRNTESASALKKRVDKAALELTYADEFDQVLINDDLEDSFEKADQIAQLILAK